MGDRADDAGRAGRGQLRTAFALGLLAMVVLGPLVARDTAQPASRYALSSALVERRTVNLDDYGRTLGVDHAVYAGHLRSDKAPGQPLLAAPFVVLGHLAGVEPGTHLRVAGNLGLWWATFWSCTVPFAVLLGLMFLMCVRHGVPARGAMCATIAVAGCTIMLPFAVNLYGHLLAAALAFGAWYVLDGTRPAPRRLVLGGLLAAAAVTVEYEAGIILAVVAADVLWRQRERIGWFVLGTVPPLAFLALYQWRAFGAPWRTPAHYYAGVIDGTTHGGYSVPALADLAGVVAGRRGLLVGAPVVIVALAAAAMLLRTGAGAPQRHALVAWAVVVPYLLLCAGWSGFKLLEEPGPRYLVPALPFVVVPLAAMWSRPVVRTGAIVAAAAGALVSVPATFTNLLVGIDENALPALWHRMRTGAFVDTTWSLGFGRLGIVLYALTIGAGGWIITTRTGVRRGARFRLA